jgi:hypothetical protein
VAKTAHSVSDYGSDWNEPKGGKGYTTEESGNIVGDLRSKQERTQGLSREQQPTLWDSRAGNFQFDLTRPTSFKSELKAPVPRPNTWYRAQEEDRAARATLKLV